MENFRRVYILAVIFAVAVIQKASPQQSRYSSSGGGQAYEQQTQWEECGIQDKDKLPDMHAAAPWAAALFFVEGDIFQNHLKPQYLNTAIFITKNLAITSGSKVLAQQESEAQTKLQLYYGHRASGKQTLIRVRKVESLNPPRQPLALKVDSGSTSSRILQTSQSQTSKSSTTGGHADLYLLHLESSIEITSFSRPLCIKKDIFPNKDLYYESGRSSNKVHISGYAAKNESAGPHVVYFSGDREWNVQNWDKDYITVMMRDTQVSYGFLPKHFNPGSAFTVKIENNFYLAGILLRSSGSLTTIRSLEKVVDMIMAKGVKSHISRHPQQQQQHQQQQQQHQGNSREQEYSRRPRPDERSNPRQPSINPGYDSYGGQQQYYQNQNPISPQYNNNPNPTRSTNHHQGSSTGEQITYLREVEASEEGDHGQHSSSNGGSSEYGSSRRTTTLRTTPNLYLSMSSTRRPSSSLSQGMQSHHQQEQEQGQQFYNPNNSNQDPYSSEPQYQSQSQQNDYGRITTTTQRATRPSQSQSQYPQYVYHPDSQRPGQQSRPQEKAPQQQQNYYQQQPPRQTRCSHDFLEGVDIECLTRQRGVSTTDCIKNAPANTKIRVSCKPHYVPLDGDKLIEKTCDSSGNWLPRKAFACKLECGNVDRSVPYIVHGSKTESEKWPWHAALFKKVNATSYNYICGATLITRSILVTAAHCVYNTVDHTLSNDAFKVVVGAISSDLFSNRKDPQAQEFNIKGIKVNEHYNPRTFEADIALVQIDKPVLLTEYVRPVCFPFPSDESKQVSSYQLSEGNSGVVVGFGTTEEWAISSTLRMATLPVVSVKDCTNVLERLPSSSQYCAGYTNGTSVCEGDSGGAQIFKDQISKRYFVQGIISHGNRKELGSVNSRCDHEKYTVFTKVGSFAEWVKEAVYDLEYDYNRRRRRK